MMNPRSLLLENILINNKGVFYGLGIEMSFFKMFFFFLSCLIILILFYTGKILKETKQKKRAFKKTKKETIKEVLLISAVVGYFGICIFSSTNYLFGISKWELINATYGNWIFLSFIALIITLFVYLLFIHALFSSEKEGEKNYAAIISLSIINGLMNTMIILTINETFNTELKYSSYLLMFFIFFVIFFVFTQKVLQEKLIKNASLLINEKRKLIVDGITDSSYEKVEKIGSSKIYTVLNSDTEAISKSPELVVTGFSSLLTIIFCMGYLGYQNFYGFVGSLSIIVLNLSFSIFVNKKASKYWTKNREMKDRYFSYTTHMLHGFRELILNKHKKSEYVAEMKNCANETTNYNVKASIKILNYNLYNITMYNIIFAVVVFIFPILLTGINVANLRETLFIVFYMLGPFQILINSISQLESLKVNMKQINDLIFLLQKSEDSKSDINMQENKSRRSPDKIELDLENIEYSYFVSDKNNNKTEFKLGPINMSIRSGEILMIIGGNGSGKSTLSKIMTGLYNPQGGVVKLNGERASMEELNECFSAIFSDFHLFNKLYGIDTNTNKQSINDLLKLMKMESKVYIDSEGNINSNELSTGQKKRLAYIISCLENKPLILLDEWAAEQDPEFKAFFYEELLSILKSQGKGIIVVTHDDQYFSVADRVIKLESGQIKHDHYMMV
ncbi:cyclic peptide export ABC transporter [Paenibacillus sp. TSA_86.1]|uniref:cyclic peptide export ABC transporter n=1 Tax=Paenibacillus sp. TSA_86.1 TaxID=3415649 RepID=UPI0040454CF0